MKYERGTMSQQIEDLLITMAVDLGPEASKAKLDSTTRQLRTELSNQWNDVELIKGEAPEGSRAVDAVVLGSLALTVVPAALTQILSFIREWCLRSESRSVEIEIKRSKHRSVKLKISGNTSTKRLSEIIDSIESLGD